MEAYLCFTIPPQPSNKTKENDAPLLTRILGAFDFQLEDDGGVGIRFLVRISEFRAGPIQQLRVDPDGNEAEAVGEEFVVQNGGVVVNEDFLDRHDRNFRQ